MNPEDLKQASELLNQAKVPTQNRMAWVGEIDMNESDKQAEPVAWILFRRDEDGLEPIRFYGSDEKPDGEFKDRFVLYPVHFEGTSLIVTALAQPVQPAKLKGDGNE